MKQKKNHFDKMTPLSLMISNIIPFYYRLEHIPLNKYGYNHELNMISLVKMNLNKNY